MTPAPPASIDGSPRFGVIDIGTNSIKLIVASVKNGRVDAHHFSRAATRLGEGLDRTGKISALAARRTALAVATLAIEARAHGARDVVAIGTYALRAARNGRPVAQAIGRRAGVRVGILTGNQEARYVLESVRARIRPLRRDVMVVDIGGGSAQLIAARGARILLVRSVPLGAVVLTERFLHHDPIDPIEYERMRARIDAVIAQLYRRLPDPRPGETDLIVSGGAATTAAAMAGVARPGKSACSVSVRVLRQLEARCLGATIAERRQIPGMQPDRADIMPAGLAVLLAFAHHARKRSVKVVDGGWREGIILELARKAQRSRPRTRPTARKPAAERRGR